PTCILARSAGARLRRGDNKLARSSLAASGAAAGPLRRHAYRARALSGMGVSGRVVLSAARTDFERIATCDTNHRRTPYVFAASGRLHEAVAQFEVALGQLPTFAEAHYELGNVRHEQGRNVEALSCYEAALRLRPDFALAHNNAANILTIFDRTDEALAHYAA